MSQEEGDMKIKRMILTVLSVMLLLTLAGCGHDQGRSSDSKNTEKGAMGTPSLRGPGKMLSDEEVRAERKAMDFEDHYRKWISDENQMRKWLNSGEQYAQWCVAMDDFIREIQSYSIEGVPEESRALYDQLLGRVMDLRDRGQRAA